MKPAFQILALLVAFLTGFFVHGFWKKEGPASSVESSRTSKSQNPSGPSSSSGGLVHETAKRSETTPKKNYLQLDPKVADVLAVNASPEMKLLRMGLDEAQMKAVREIRTAGQAELKQIEKGHATPKSDGQGEYVEINAFPEDREKWIAGMSRKLRELLGDDRAEVAARIIAFDGNDAEVGLYRREVFVTNGDQEGKARIEEKIFGQDGKHIDSDYEVVDANTLGRWGHVLESGGK